MSAPGREPPVRRWSQFDPEQPRASAAGRGKRTAGFEPGTLDRLQRFDRAHDPLRSGPHPAARVEPAVERASAWFELASGIFFRPHRRCRSGDPGRQPRNADSAGKPRTHLRAVLAPLDIREPRRPRSRASARKSSRLRRPPRRRIDGGFRHALHRANSLLGTHAAG